MTKTVACLAISLLIGWTGVLAFSTASGSPSVTGVAISGNLVVAQITNNTAQVMSGTIGVCAVVSDTPIWGYSPFVIQPGGSLAVPIVYPGTVSQVQQVRVN